MWGFAKSTISKIVVLKNKGVLIPFYSVQAKWVSGNLVQVLGK
jgi:hypothetical protein